MQYKSETVKYRKLGKIDLESFKLDVLETELLKHPSDDLDILIDQYNTCLSDVLEKYAPEKCRRIIDRPFNPWFNEHVNEAKRERRKYERKWKKSKLNCDYEQLNKQKNKVNNLILGAKKEYYNRLISDNKGNQKALFGVLKKLLNKRRVTLPEHESADALASDFNNFFVEKIAKIRSTFDENTVYNQYDKPREGTNPPGLNNFTELSEEQVLKLIQKSRPTYCELDPIPTALLKECTSILIKPLTKIINLSLSLGYVPSSLKSAVIKPLLKKPGLETIYKNYRPVSNLTYISKLIERVVSEQVTKYKLDNDLQEKFQSAYKKFHSTESALLKVHNDILSAMDDKKVVLLTLLDLSSAFDTVDHDILLSRLKSRFKIDGVVLDWFRSYLSDRHQCVSINGNKSASHPLHWSVPQGSGLGPDLYCDYCDPLGQIIMLYLLLYHLFADDSQIMTSFNPNDVQEQSEAFAKIESCAAEISKWMANNKLKLNEDKTEFVILGKDTYTKKVTKSSINIGGNEIPSSVSVRNLGAWLDKEMTMETHVNNVCKTAYLHLRNIRYIRNFLTEDATKTIIQAFVTSRLDYGNSLLYGISRKLMRKLERIQNYAARIIVGAGRYEHITPILKELHWLPVEQRINYKIMTFVYKVLNDLAPEYLRDLLTPYIPTRSLRSAGDNKLVEPKTQFVTCGERAFYSCGPKLWNKLPQQIRHCATLETFKLNVKTHLFRECYG